MPSSTVLLIDGDPARSSFLAARLTRYGFQARTAATGREGITSYRQNPASVVLLDLKMPDLNGVATLKALQQIDPDVRCCFMSGQYGMSEHQQGRLAFVSETIRSRGCRGDVVEPPDGTRCYPPDAGSRRKRFKALARPLPTAPNRLYVMSGRAELASTGLFHSACRSSNRGL